MYITIEEQNELKSIFETCELPRSTSAQIVALLSHWEQHKGISFVVNRLKSYRSLLLGRPIDSRWKIALRNGIPTGPFGFVFKKAAKSRRSAIKADIIFRVYQRWTAKTNDSDFSEYCETLKAKEC